MPAVRLFALIICCLAIPTDALAAAWKHVAVSDDGLVNFYVDAESVAAKGPTLRVRLLFDFSKVQQDPDTLIEHRSTIEIAFLDFLGQPNGEHGVLQQMLYMYNMMRLDGKPISVTS